MLMVREVVVAAGPFSAIVTAPKAFVTFGGATTSKLAVAVLPVSPLVELTAPVVLVQLPTVLGPKLSSRGWSLLLLQGQPPHGRIGSGCFSLHPFLQTLTHGTYPRELALSIALLLT